MLQLAANIFKYFRNDNSTFFVLSYYVYMCVCVCVRAIHDLGRRCHGFELRPVNIWKHPRVTDVLLRTCDSVARYSECASESSLCDF